MLRHDRRGGSPPERAGRSLEKILVNLLTRRSHIAPSCGTSCLRLMERIWSRVLMAGERPPWTQKSESSTRALRLR